MTNYNLPEQIIGPLRNDAILIQIIFRVQKTHNFPSKRVTIPLAQEDLAIGRVFVRSRDPSLLTDVGM